MEIASGICLVSTNGPPHSSNNYAFVIVALGMGDVKIVKLNRARCRRQLPVQTAGIKSQI
jgi:hypothetical protein